MLNVSIPVKSTRKIIKEGYSLRDNGDRISLFTRYGDLLLEVVQLQGTRVMLLSCEKFQECTEITDLIIYPNLYRVLVYYNTDEATGQCFSIEIPED